MMKMIIYSVVLAVVYFIVMDMINTQINNFDLNSESIIATSEDKSYLDVTIDGAVNNPGTYTVAKGENLSFLIALAGGVKENADASSYDLNVKLIDNSHYYISSVNSELEKVSINNANIAKLDTLPGIGNVLAKRIVSYRNSNGNFSRIEDIKNVSGIGTNLFEQIKDLICL